MKTILFMAATPNGIIAKENDDASFVSKADWKRFKAAVKKIGCAIYGRRTFEAIIRDGEFPLDCLNVIMTSKQTENKWRGRAIFTNKSPKEVLQMLKQKSFKTAVLAGGGHLNASFMKENLIDEIFVDVEPTILGRGINLFEGADFEAKLKLLAVKKLSASEVQLHYKVLK